MTRRLRDTIDLVTDRAWLEDFDAAIAGDRVCEICGRKPFIRSKLGGRRALVVDHNHLTGETRGFLCGNCNTGLGMFGDSIELLKVAVRYLEERGSYAT